MEFFVFVYTLGMNIDTNSSKIEELLTRGVDQVVDKANLSKRLASGQPLRVKLGIDPTSPNIHLGRAVPLLKLKDFQDLGHQVVFVIGDFTGVIGDTSDKQSERPMLTEEEVKENLKTYIDQAGKILNIDKCEVVFNSKWLAELNFKQVAEMATAFSLHDFIARKNIKDRLDAGSRVSLRELLYPLMQGYDSVQINADIELGGTDQWFNLLAGRTLMEWYGKQPQDILTTNLILGTDGRKMSSSWGNTINLTDTPENMYGKVMSIPDNQIITYFVHCTRRNMGQISVYEKALKDGQNPKEIKQFLASSITEMFYGKDGADKGADYFTKVITEKGMPDDIPTKTASSTNIVDVLVETGLASSKSEARRLIEQGGVEINGEKVSSTDTEVPENAIIKKGKRDFIKLD